MGKYVTIYFGTGTPGAKAVEYDNAMLVVDASESSETISESTVYEITSAEDLTDYGFASSTRAYKSAASFFAASPTPSKLFVYAYVSSAGVDYEDYNLEKVTDTKWETPLKPPTGFAPSGTGDEKVYFYGCDDSDSYTANYADGSQGLPFTVYEDEESNWTGQLRFPSGLSGSEGITTESNLTADCKITCDFTIGSIGGIGEAIDDYNINFIALAMDNSEEKTNYESDDSPLAEDEVSVIMDIKNAIAGKECIFIFALPGDASPTGTLTGSSVEWAGLRNNLVGAREDVVAIKFKPSGTDETETDDMAAGYMGMIIASHPHTTMTFAQPHMGIAEAEKKINVNKWDDGKIGSIFQNRNLSGDPYMVSYGFTFGSGDANRINMIRCRYILAQTLRNTLHALLARREYLVNIAGCDAVEAAIRGAISNLISQGIIDGLENIEIPLREELADNTAAAQQAVSNNQIPAVHITYQLFKSIEEITIASVDNTATT